MNKTPKVDRARRNALKAGGLVLGAAIVAVSLPKVSSATPGNNGNGKGGCGVGQQTNGCGGNSGGLCFARGTQIRTREGYRPIETLAAGDEVAVRSGGVAPIKAIVSHAVDSESGNWVGKSNL